MSEHESATAEVQQPEVPEYVRHEVGRLEYLDPRTLVVDPFNHRKDRDGQPVEPDADLIASVETGGVHTPITVRPQADGTTLGVIAGQRRLLAAQLAAKKAAKARKPIPLVPALVRDDLAAVDDDALVMSLIENTQRRDATTRDTVEALSLLSGMELTTVQRKRHAKSLGIRPEEIAAAAKVAELDDRAMSNALGSFDLVEAAEYAEVAELSDAKWKLEQAKREDAAAKDKGRGKWKHCLEQLRQRLAERQARAALEEELRGNAVTIVRHRYTWDGSPARPLTDLLTAAGKGMTKAHHAKTCHHHAAYIHPDKVRAVWMCADWRAAGHQLTPKAAETETAPQQQASREEAAAERRAVIEGNKAWRAARVVRQEFIAALIADKRGVSDAAWLMTLRTISSTSYMWHHFTGRQSTDLVALLLGVADPNEGNSRHKRIADPFESVIGRTSKARRGSFIFAQVAAAWEEHAMGERAWRGSGRSTIEWLTFLQGEGYTLSEIEANVMTGASEEPEAGALAEPDPETVETTDGDADPADENDAETVEAKPADAADTPEEARGTWPCPDCGTTNADTDSVCMVCDHDAEAEDAVQAADGDADQDDEDDEEIRRQEAHADCIEPHRNAEGEYVDCDGRPI